MFSNRNKNKGFSIAEILIAMTIGIILTGFIISIFSSNKKAYYNNNRMIELNSNIRFATDTIRGDLVNVGFYGGLTSKDSISARISNFTQGNCSSDPFASQFPIWGGTIASSPPRDFISVKGVLPQTTDDTDLAPDAVYIRAGKTTGEFIANGLGSSIPDSANMNWEYYSHVYYINDNRLIRETLLYNDPADPNTSYCEQQVLVGPCLYYKDDPDNNCTPESLKDDADNANMLYYKDLCMQEPSASNCEYNHLEAGVEALSFSYGVDDDQDGVANYFTDGDTIGSTSASWTTWNNVVEVKIYILARSDQDRTYTDSKTYTLGDTTIDNNNLDDNYHRKLFSITVFLRNTWYDILNDPSNI